MLKDSELLFKPHRSNRQSKYTDENGYVLIKLQTLKLQKHEFHVIFTFHKIVFFSFVPPPQPFKKRKTILRPWGIQNQVAGQIQPLEG